MKIAIKIVLTFSVIFLALYLGYNKYEDYLKILGLEMHKLELK
jgi:hypothetical protein